ncbi:MAG: LytTR family DNA-binding domain-containing protein [Paludibacter sp.]
MTAVIVEDEVVASQKLQRLISQVAGDIQVIACLQSVEESIEWFALNAAPDMVFMDIHLADGSAFSIFEKVNVTSPIIFTTAYDEYALKAFEVNSIDYLLKPISTKNLERAITKLRSRTATNSNESDIIANLLATFKQSKEVYKSHFLIPHKDKFIPLAIDTIACFYTENKMVKIITKDDKTYHMDSTLEDLTNQLDPLQFFRANRQYIVSHNAIKDISIWFGSKLSVNLNVQVPEKIIVSKARVTEFKTWYTK